MKRMAFVGLLILFPAIAHAGLEARFAFAFPTPDGRIHYVYRVLLVSGSLDPGSAFSQHVTLYDLPALIPGSTNQPADWSGSVQATGSDADDLPLTGKTDSPRLLNVTWTWNGTTAVEAPFDFGLFSFDLAGHGATSGTRLFIGQSSGSGAPRVLSGRTTGAIAVTP
ncbi:MAG: hypothetical protein ACLGH0_03185 [Thermoanaerobaculia bacterium]